MSKPKAQGTAWETAFVNAAQDQSLLAGRIVEGGRHDVGDVYLGDLPSRGDYPNDIAVLAWSRLVPNGKLRRAADGERSVVVIATQDFLRLAYHCIEDHDYAFVVECKAAERLNVTRALANAKLKLFRWKSGKTA